MNASTLFDHPDNSSGDRRRRGPDTPTIERPAANASAAEEVVVKRGDSCPEPLLVDVRAAARMLSVSRALVYELMAAGELPSVVIHRCRRIAVDELRSYVERLAADR